MVYYFLWFLFYIYILDPGEEALVDSTGTLRPKCWYRSSLEVKFNFWRMLSQFICNPIEIFVSFFGSFVRFIYLERIFFALSIISEPNTNSMGFITAGRVFVYFEYSIYSHNSVLKLNKRCHCSVEWFWTHSNNEVIIFFNIFQSTKTKTKTKTKT